jgi:hypothetical protein
MRAALLGLAVVLVACGESGQQLPRITFPQLEQTRESVHGGIGKRYQDHTACKGKSTDAKSMVACMEAAGYGYLPRSAEPQAAECWRLRDANEVDPLPEALCFVHNAEPAP